MVTAAKTGERLRTRNHLAFAKAMRRQPTEAEARFWHYAKNRGIGGLKFRRQVVVGRYIADYLCAEKMLIVEIDGGQHVDSARDEGRDAFLMANGYRVLRFWNADVLTDMVVVGERILAAVRDADDE